MSDDLRAMLPDVGFEFTAGRELRFRRVSIGALAEAVEALKRRVVQRAVAGIGDEATPEEKAAVARQVAVDIERNGNSIDLETVDGLLEILWVCARGLNDGLTREDLGAMITMGEMPALSDFLRRDLMGMPDDAEDEPKNAAAAAAGSP